VPPREHEEAQWTLCRKGIPKEIWLEAVMNSIRNGLGMRKTGDCWRPYHPEKPHSNAVFIQVHNTL
jgi:hypothetical protein